MFGSILKSDRLNNNEPTENVAHLHASVNDPLAQSIIARDQAHHEKKQGIIDAITDG